MKNNMFRTLTKSNAQKNTSKYNHKEHELSSTTLSYGERLVVKIKDVTPDRSSPEYKEKVKECLGANSKHCGRAYYQELVETFYPVVDFSKKAEQKKTEIA